MQKPVVSVSITTYNLEHYVRKTLQSVVDQETDFPIEIVVGDDCSTDNTRQIILEMKAQHPDKQWKLLFNEKNEGVSVLFPKVIQACKGDYIATLDGDDYWTDPLKLQKQYGFLQANKAFKACCTDYTVINQDENIMQADYLKAKAREEYSLNDILQSLTPPRHTAFFDVKLVPEKFPENYSLAKVNDDHYFFALIAEDSDIKVMDINTAHYRKHTGSLYSERPYDYKVENLITTNKCMMEHFKKISQKKILVTTLFGLYSRLSRYYLANIKPGKFIKSYGKFLNFSFVHKPSLFFKYNYHLMMTLFSRKMRVFQME